MDELIINLNKHDIIEVDGTALYTLPCGPDSTMYDVEKQYCVNYAMENDKLVMKRWFRF